MLSGIVGSNTHRRSTRRSSAGSRWSTRSLRLCSSTGPTRRRRRSSRWPTSSHTSGSASRRCRTPASTRRADNRVERWCNAVAAEILVPARVSAQRVRRRRGPDGRAAAPRAALQGEHARDPPRVADAGFLTGRIPGGVPAELERVLSWSETPAAASFFNTQPVRASKRFTRAIIASTSRARPSSATRSDCSGFKKSSTFDELREKLGSLERTCWTRTSSSRPRTATTRSTSALDSGHGLTRPTTGLGPQHPEGARGARRRRRRARRLGARPRLSSSWRRMTTWSRVCAT